MKRKPVNAAKIEAEIKSDFYTTQPSAGDFVTAPVADKPGPAFSVTHCAGHHIDSDHARREEG